VKTAALAVAALLLVSRSAAQAPPPPPPGWSGEAGLSYVQTAGNSQSSTIGAGLKLIYQRRPWRLSLGTSFIRTETDDVTSAEKFDSMLRAERGFGERLAVYGQGSFLHEPFAGIDGQETFEAGGLYKPAIGPRHFVSLSAALAYTAEQRGGSSPDRNFAGARAGVAYKWQLSRNAAVHRGAELSRASGHPRTAARDTARRSRPTSTRSSPSSWPTSCCTFETRCPASGAPTTPSWPRSWRSGRPRPPRLRRARRARDAAGPMNHSGH
jgi:putative salt-induced outer membrane protein YdiY